MNTLGQARQGLHGLRILLVDDNLQNLQVASRLMQSLGAVVVPAANGQLALEALRASTKPFDIVLMGVSMPVMDGCMATRQIRENPQWARMPVVAFTAESRADECLQAGMQDFFPKPFLLNELVQVIWRNIDRCHA